MIISPELLEKARKAEARFTEVERQAELARADYHTAVRRLHLAGGSLREIAQALSLSHQRVQQIVSGAGGSWWRRVWRTRTVRRDAVCTWCGRPPAEVAKLIAGPNVFICDTCVRSAEDAAGGRRAAGPFDKVREKSVTARCAFCGKRTSGNRALIVAPAGHVCTDCLRVCRDILDAASHAPGRSQ